MTLKLSRFLNNGRGSATGTGTGTGTGDSLPAQPGNSGKYLTTNGDLASWTTIATGLTPTTVKTTHYTAVTNELVRCNSVAGEINITLPTLPADGSIVGIIDINNTAGTNNLVVYPSSGISIERDATSYILDISSAYVTFMYNSSMSNWQLLETPSAPGSSGGGSGGVSALTMTDTYTSSLLQTVFTLSHQPVIGGALTLVVNGVSYTNGVDFTVAGTILTWLNIDFVLDNTDVLDIEYNY